MHSLKTIRGRLFALGALSLFGLLVAGGFGLLQLARLDRGVSSDLARLDRMTSIGFEVQGTSIDFKTQVQEWKNILIRGNDPEQLRRYREGFEKKAKSVSEGLAAIGAHLRSEGSPRVAELEALSAAHARMLEHYLVALQSFDPADPESGKKVDKAVKGIDRSTTEAMAALAGNIEGDARRHLAQTRESTHALYTTGLLMLGIAIAALSALLLLGTVITVRKLSQSVAALQQTLGRARTHLDLTVRAPDSSGDELAHAGASVNALFEELQSVIRLMRDNAQHVASHSSSLHVSVDTLASSVTEQNESTANMAAAAEELAVSVALVSSSAGSAHDVAQASMEHADFGGRVIGSATESMQQAAVVVQAAAGGIDELGLRVEDIGKIAGAINDIADQTNMLALNAAIEAARAGEQGRGFAVVADEVRKLAERTALATREIDKVIESVQSASDQTRVSMHTLVARFEDITASTREAGQAISDIRSESHKVVSTAEDISRALCEQSMASESIAQQIERIAGMSDSNSRALTHISESAVAMDAVSQSMRQRLDSFIV